MPSVAAALRQHAPVASPASPLPTHVAKVFSAITRCRTGQLGGVRYECDGCGREHWVGRSCGNRHCPTCGHEKTQRWIEKQHKRLMPVHHFLVTFTVPRELGLVLRGCPRAGYRCLFDAAAESIRDCGSATRELQGCQLGYFGVLHTWGRDPMVYHPHVHFVVPGGGVKVDDSGRALGWQSTAENFLFPHATLVRIYRAKLADELRAAGLLDSVDREVWQRKFVVDIRPVGDGSATLKYLAPYVHRVAISDRRIVAVGDSTVTYRFTPSGTKASRERTVSGDQFVEGFARHVLPQGFQKVRHYGWMSANSRVSLAEVKWLVWLFLGWTYWLASAHAPPPEPLTATLRCGQCGGRLQVVAVTFQPSFVPSSLDDHRQPYFDSG
jgi:predicted RNA-binding Zn-ribbon protein involved in translation (DUF1610 family)